MMGRRGFMVVAMAALAFLVTGCSGSRMPSFEHSGFRHLSGGYGPSGYDYPVARLGWGGPLIRPGTAVAMSEEDIQKEVERLMSLSPKEPAPRKVMLYEVGSFAHSIIASPKKRIELARATSAAVEAALVGTGALEEVAFLPDVLLPSSGFLDLNRIRLAAARAQADGALIYAVETGYEYESNVWAIFYLTIIGAGFAPGTDYSALAASKAVLMDVHTGYIYAIVEANTEKTVTRPFCALDREALEVEVRTEAMAALAAKVADAVKELASEE